MCEAIGKAKSSRTVAHKKAVVASRVSEERVLCTYVATKNKRASPSCKHLAVKAVSGRGNKPQRCYQHRILTPVEMMTLSVHKAERNYFGLVRLGSSSLPKELNAGDGVFANKHFDKGESITWYAGTTHSLEEVEEMRGTPEHDYVILPTRTGIRQLAKPYWLGIMKPEVGKGLGSFVNAPYIGPLYQANCAFRFDATIQCPVIYALRDIWPGEELYMAYRRGKRGSHVAVVAD